jgi:hypothetical protein
VGDDRENFDFSYLRSALHVEVAVRKNSSAGLVGSRRKEGGELALCTPKAEDRRLPSMYVLKQYLTALTRTRGTRNDGQRAQSMTSCKSPIYDSDEGEMHWERANISPSRCEKRAIALPRPFIKMRRLPPSLRPGTISVVSFRAAAKLTRDTLLAT